MGQQFRPSQTNKQAPAYIANRSTWDDVRSLHGRRLNDINNQLEEQMKSPNLMEMSSDSFHELDALRAYNSVQFPAHKTNQEKLDDFLGSIIANPVIFILAVIASAPIIASVIKIFQLFQLFQDSQRKARLEKNKPFEIILEDNNPAPANKASN